MWNIFIALMTITLAFAFFDPNFFVAYLISIAVFGLFQAIYMANAGGAWDNAKKCVEVDLKEKGTPLHDATVIGDTVGDPFKDYQFGRFESDHQVQHCSVCWPSKLHLRSRRPQTMAVAKTTRRTSALGMLAIALYFVWRSFYMMRIPEKDGTGKSTKAH